MMRTLASALVALALTAAVSLGVGVPLYVEVTNGTQMGPRVDMTSTGNIFRGTFVGDASNRWQFIPMPTNPIPLAGGMFYSLPSNELYVATNASGWYGMLGALRYSSNGVDRFVAMEGALGIITQNWYWATSTLAWTSNNVLWLSNSWLGSVAFAIAGTDTTRWNQAADAGTNWLTWAGVWSNKLSNFVTDAPTNDWNQAVPGAATATNWLGSNSNKLGAITQYWDSVSNTAFAGSNLAASIASGTNQFVISNDTRTVNLTSTNNAINVNYWATNDNAVSFRRMNDEIEAKSGMDLYFATNLASFGPVSNMYVDVLPTGHGVSVLTNTLGTVGTNIFGIWAYEPTSGTIPSKGWNVHAKGTVTKLASQTVSLFAEILDTQTNAVNSFAAYYPLPNGDYEQRTHTHVTTNITSTRVMCRIGAVRTGAGTAPTVTLTLADGYSHVETPGGLDTATGGGSGDFKADGSVAMTGNLNFGGNRGTNAGMAVLTNDLMTLGQGNMMTNTLSIFTTNLVTGTSNNLLGTIVATTNSAAFTNNVRAAQTNMDYSFKPRNGGFTKEGQFDFTTNNLITNSACNILDLSTLTNSDGSAAVPVGSSWVTLWCEIRSSFVTELFHLSTATNPVSSFSNSVFAIRCVVANGFLEGSGAVPITTNRTLYYNQTTNGTWDRLRIKITGAGR